MPDVCPNRTACSLGASRGVELPYTCGSPSISVFIFFFQAVDGIRAHCVTGVQTCALPIFRLARRKSDSYSIAVLQVDAFASLATSFGSAAANAVLRAIGELLPKSFRAEDVPGWWSGAEFTDRKSVV